MIGKDMTEKGKKRASTSFRATTQYIYSEGKDLVTGKLLTLKEGEESRVAWSSGINLGYKLNSPDRIEMAIQDVEDLSLFNQTSKVAGRKIKDHSLHLILSWKVEENPTEEKMKKAASGVLEALGMGNAIGLMVAHNDTDNPHLHINVSRINPETGKAFHAGMTKRKIQAFCRKWEKENGIIVTFGREHKADLDAAIAERDADLAMQKLLTQRSVVSGRTIEAALNAAFPKEGELQQFKQEMVESKGVIQLFCPKTGKALNKWTTERILRIEKSAVACAEKLHSRNSSISPWALKKSEGFIKDLSTEQKDAFRFATSGRSMAIIDGKAGTGKSTVLQAINKSFEIDGYDVIGIAPTHMTRKAFAKDGVKTVITSAKALKLIREKKMMVDDKTVFILEEAGMISNEELFSVLKLAVANNSKVLVSGDYKQLMSIERGGMLEMLFLNYGGKTLKEIWRQKDSDQKEISMRLAEGNIQAAVELWAVKEQLKIDDHREEAMNRLLDDWKKDWRENSEVSRFVYAWTNKDNKEINAKIRGFLVEEGVLNEGIEVQTSKGIKKIAIGDKILITSTKKKIGAFNGDRGVVTYADPDKMKIKTEEGKLVTIPYDEFDEFDYGYAGTVHKGQGATVSDAYIFHSRYFSARGIYVAGTRHKNNLKIYASQEEIEQADPWMRLDGGLELLNVMQKKSSYNSYRKWKREGESSNFLAERPAFGSWKVATEDLSPEQEKQAVFAYNQWSNDPDIKEMLKAQGLTMFSFGEYVTYVQDKQKRIEKLTKQANNRTLSHDGYVTYVQDKWAVQDKTDRLTHEEHLKNRLVEQLSRKDYKAVASSYLDETEAKTLRITIKKEAFDFSKTIVKTPESLIITKKARSSLSPVIMKSLTPNEGAANINKLQIIKPQIPMGKIAEAFPIFADPNPIAIKKATEQLLWTTLLEKARGFFQEFCPMGIHPQTTQQEQEFKL